MKNNPRVVIVVGSKTDLNQIKETTDFFKKTAIAFDLKVLSAHRMPSDTAVFARGAANKGYKVIIASAGGAAALAGVIASHTTLPVVAIPVLTKSLNGLDSLLSVVQMPKGVPVASMAIGKAGAKNAGIFAAQILALSDKKLSEKLVKYKKNLSTKA